MPKKSRFFGGGFVDIISLVAVVFLAVSAITGAIAISKQKESFDIRNKAATTNYQKCSDVPINQCASVDSCSLISNTSSSTTACTASDCSSGVAGCASQYTTTSNGHCSCTEDLSTATTQATCKSSAFLGTCTWVAPVVTQVCTGNKTSTTTTQTCEGTIQTKTATPLNCSGSGGSCLDPHYCCGGLNCNTQNICASPTPTPTKSPTSNPTPTPTRTPTPTSKIAKTRSPAPTPNCTNYGACYPTSYVCQTSFGQVNCGQNFKCGIHCAPATPHPTPTKSPTPSSTPSCGSLYQPCCGPAYPNGHCNSGFYCSNIDTGICITNICHAERKCSGSVLQICKDDNSGWNNTTCLYGCNPTTKDCYLSPTPTPIPTPITSGCPKNSWPVYNDLGINYIIQGPLTPQGYTHHNVSNAVDIGVVDEYIVALNAGIIDTVGNDSCWGRYLRVASTCNGSPFKAYYGHLSAISVSTGQTVRAGQILGVSGDSGSCAAGHPHLHFQFEDAGSAPTLNLPYLKRNIPTGCTGIALCN